MLKRICEDARGHKRAGVDRGAVLHPRKTIEVGGDGGEGSVAARLVANAKRLYVDGHDEGGGFGHRAAAGAGWRTSKRNDWTPSTSSSASSALETWRPRAPPTDLASAAISTIVWSVPR